VLDSAAKAALFGASKVDVSSVEICVDSPAASMSERKVLCDDDWIFNKSIKLRKYQTGGRTSFTTCNTPFDAVIPVSVTGAFAVKLNCEANVFRKTPVALLMTLTVS
jgi:hypothetical protein